MQDRKALEHPAELSFLFLSRGEEDIRGRKARRTGKLRNILLSFLFSFSLEGKRKKREKSKKRESERAEKEEGEEEK